jgi:hypothetical protein
VLPAASAWREIGEVIVEFDGLPYFSAFALRRCWGVVGDNLERASRNPQHFIPNPRSDR